MSTHDIELISDGDGIAVIGDSKAVEAFLASEGLPSKELDLPRLSTVMNAGGGAAQAGALIASQSGRWVQLTADSARQVQKFGLMPTGKAGVSHAMIGQPGKVKSWIQISKGPGTVAANPALLAGAAGIMTQLAMQQAMNEITAYLEKLDAKLDDVLRAQKDAVISKMIGVGFDIEEALTLREHVGKVNEVTWSKVQSASSTIASTQSYALLQLDALADNLKDRSRISVLLDAVKEAEAKTQEWLAVLARCFQLQDAIAVLELDRVFETAPDDLDGHRLGLKAARSERLKAISRTTGALLSRMSAAAAGANQKVLFNPSQSPAIVSSNAQVNAVVTEFHGLLGIESADPSLAARRWREAAADAKDRVRDLSAEKVDVAKRFGGEARQRALSAKESLTDRVRRRDGDDIG